MEIVSVNNCVVDYRGRVSSVRMEIGGMKSYSGVTKYLDNGEKKVLVAFGKNQVEVFSRLSWQDRREAGRSYFEASLLKADQSQGKNLDVLKIRGDFGELEERGLRMKMTDLDIGVVEKERWESVLGVRRADENTWLLTKVGSALVIETLSLVEIKGEKKAKSAPSARVSFIVTNGIRDN